MIVLKDVSCYGSTKALTDLSMLINSEVHELSTSMKEDLFLQLYDIVYEFHGDLSLADSLRAIKRLMVDELIPDSGIQYPVCQMSNVNDSLTVEHFDSGYSGCSADLPRANSGDDVQHEVARGLNCEKLSTISEEIAFSDDVFDDEPGPSSVGLIAKNRLLLVSGRGRKQNDSARFDGVLLEDRSERKSWKDRLINFIGKFRFC